MNENEKKQLVFLLNVASFIAIIGGGVLLGAGTSPEIGAGASLLTWANYKPFTM